MNSAERETDAGKITKERFLKDLRPIIDEALEKRVGVNSVDLYSVDGRILGSEEIKVYFREEGAPEFSSLVISPNNLYVDKYVSEMSDWDRTFVDFGRSEGEDVAKPMINETNTPNQELTETQWVRVLEKAKNALTLAITGQSKVSESKRAGETGEGQNFIQEYDKLFQGISENALGKTLTLPSVLYPDAEYRIALVFINDSTQKLVMQNLCLKVEGQMNGSQKPTARLMTVNGDPQRKYISRSIAIFESPIEIKWQEHEDRQRGAQLTSEEERWAHEAASKVLESAKHSTGN
ncbi:hypothetical protein HY502_01905 [Candidatus Woesebacteria bacterium]|nr:hypothetical protein [Candidatus Woesebacteria bacterium]